MSKKVYVKPYPKEFREQVVSAGAAGGSQRAGGGPGIRDFGGFGDGAGCSRRSATRAAVTDGLSSPEREELVRLRRETRRLRMEREILSKAAAWFARETDSIA